MIANTNYSLLVASPDSSLAGPSNKTVDDMYIPEHARITGGNTWPGIYTYNLSISSRFGLIGRTHRRNMKLAIRISAELRAVAMVNQLLIVTELVS